VRAARWAGASAARWAGAAAGWDRGSSAAGTEAARAIGGASRTGDVSISPNWSPSAVMSSCARANPVLRFAERRRNMPNKSTIPASLQPFTVIPRLCLRTNRFARQPANMKTGFRPSRATSADAFARIMLK
jgi:hypothetical protein